MYPFQGQSRRGVGLENLLLPMSHLCNGEAENEKQQPPILHRQKEIRAAL